MKGVARIILALNLVPIISCAAGAAPIGREFNLDSRVFLNRSILAEPILLSNVTALMEHFNRALTTESPFSEQEMETLRPITVDAIVHFFYGAKAQIQDPANQGKRLVFSALGSDNRLTIKDRDSANPVTAE